MYAWIDYYNGCWSVLANEIERTIKCGWESSDALINLVGFLRKHNNVELTI
jgi:hypothetical protein